MRSRVLLHSLLCAAFLLSGASLRAADISQLQQSFEKPPDDSKFMVRWWWFGSSVTKPEIERELKVMKEGGVGGVEVQPTYPLVPDDLKLGVKNLPFLSDEFLDALRFTSGKAAELGLRLDLTLGSGWPFGGPAVPVAQAAGRLRCDRVRTDGASRRVAVPEIGAGEDLVAAYAAPLTGKTFDASALKQVMDIRDRVLYLPRDITGPAQVLFFISSRTGMQVKRPAVNAEGFVLDHYSTAAVDNYLKTVGDRLMQAFKGIAPPYAVFCDSLEVYGTDWTDDLLQEFQKRRGYDLTPLLTALVADIGPATSEIRHDWGKTLTELYTERFAARITDWAKRNQTRFRIQGYGSPPAALFSYAASDLAEGEGPLWKSFSSTRWAASASHLLGRPVTSSETWTWLHSPAFRATPLDMKVEADRHFLNGINQLIAHGWPYTSEGQPYPGWRFYAAAVFNEKNPWWQVMPDVAAYMQRVSYMMRQGTPANDVALYLDNSDAWASFESGGGNVEMGNNLARLLGQNVMAQLLDNGYNLDFFDDQMLEQFGKVDQGSLAFTNTRYKVVVLAGVDRMPVATLRTLEQFARGGGILVATRRLPATAPGYQATDAEKTEVKSIVERLFGGPTAPGIFVEEEAELGKVLASRLKPDVLFSPAAPDMGFVHRNTSDSEIYFLANTGNTRQRVKASFRVEGMQPEWWDPMSGKVSPAEILEKRAGATVVAADIEPYGSRLLVFSNRSLPRPAAVALAEAVPPALDMSRGWRVTFGQGAKSIQMDTLRSWTDDEETRYFSGVATYEKNITVPGAMLQSGLKVRIDFGEAKPVSVTAEMQGGSRPFAAVDAPVRESAVVYVNDKRAGSVWCAPFAVDVTGLLQKGQNRIRITVGNLALNYMAGHSLPDYRLLNLRYTTRFEPQDMQLVRPIPAGLLGAIRLVSARP